MKRVRHTLGTQEIYIRKHLTRRRRESKEIMVTNYQRINKSCCRKI
jgi:hypothetical protein